jgi:hypothetical protein
MGVWRVAGVLAGGRRGAQQGGAHQHTQRTQSCFHRRLLDGDIIARAA